MLYLWCKYTIKDTTMFIWKYLDLPETEVEELKARYLASQSTWKSDHYFFQSLNLGIKEFMGRPIFKTVLIVASPNLVGKLHIDHRPHDNNTLAINIPLLNCDNAVTEFWESHEASSVVEYTISGSPYLSCGNRSTCTKIDEYQLVKPVLFTEPEPLIGAITEIAPGFEGAV
jgi:hypothetical protein